VACQKPSIAMCRMGLLQNKWCACAREQAISNESHAATAATQRRIEHWKLFASSVSATLSASIDVCQPESSRTLLWRGQYRTEALRHAAARCVTRQQRTCNNVCEQLQSPPCACCKSVCQYKWATTTHHSSKTRCRCHWRGSMQKGVALGMKQMVAYRTCRIFNDNMMI